MPAHANRDSFLFVINQKLLEITFLFNNEVLDSRANPITFFGRDLSIEDNRVIGGDSALFNTIHNIGIYGLLGLFSILIWASERGTRIYIIGAFVASLHYGALFSLAGQFFFAAVVNNAIYRESYIRTSLKRNIPIGLMDEKKYKKKLEK